MMNLIYVRFQDSMDRVLGSSSSWGESSADAQLIHGDQHRVGGVEQNGRISGDLFLIMFDLVST